MFDFINDPSLGAPSWFLPAFVGLLLWNGLWKGLALWHAAKRKDVKWFVILIFISAAGLVEIPYLFLVARVRIRELFT